MRNKRKYDPEFKREAVRLVIDEGLAVREVERDLGILWRLEGWVQKHHNHQDAAFVGTVSLQSPEAELKQLRKENDRLRWERDILKKVVLSSRRTRIDIRVHKRVPLQIWSGGDVPRFWSVSELVLHITYAW